MASFYAESFHGRKTTWGETYNHWGLTAASNNHKYKTKLRVCRADKASRCVNVVVNDTGQLYGRFLDLSGAAASKLRMLKEGVIPITVEVL